MFEPALSGSGTGGTSRAVALHGHVRARAGAHRVGSQRFKDPSHAPETACLTFGPDIDQTLFVSLAEDGLSLSGSVRSPAPAGEKGEGPLTVLARAALSNEPEDVRRFLDAIAPTVRRTCRGVMGPSHPDLEDTIQESLMDLVRALPQFRFEADVSRYAAKIALRVAIAERKKDRARLEGLRLLHQSHASRPPSLDPAGVVAEVECSWLTSLVVRKLKRSQAEVVLLRILHGMFGGGDCLHYRCSARHRQDATAHRKGQIAAPS